MSVLNVAEQRRIAVAAALARIRRAAGDARDLREQRRHGQHLDVVAGGGHVDDADGLLGVR